MPSMPLMGKKAPTAAELYRARRQKEEEEKDAFLPPGLVNHGNTCFMNSVLQGLIATPMLSDIVLFTLPETYLPVSSRRSPQLTNGHGRGDQWEREWEKGMPLGDTFVRLMTKAWKLQEEKTRQSMSPKEILGRLGAKYDQYLDFRQQDAHELLRHLLDAMRMEELDIIKKRQPPPPKVKRKRRTSDVNLASSITSLNNNVTSISSPVSDPIPEEDRLTSFVDMVFGGQLASILVCEKCKKVSCTFEDFNDLSLSIKPEDYEKARKRDRIKSLAKKFKMRGLDFSGPPARSSSTPASPTRRSLDVERTFEQTVSDVEQRRRSLDAGDEAATLVNEHHGVKPEGESRAAPSEDVVILASEKEEGQAHVETVTTEPQEKGKWMRVYGEIVWIGPQITDKQKRDLKKEKAREKEGDEDGWVKLSRRISVGMGLKKGRRAGKSRDSPRGNAIIEDTQEDIATRTAIESADSTPNMTSTDLSLQSATPPPAIEGQPILTASTSNPSPPPLPAPVPNIALSRRPSPRRTVVSSPLISAVTSPSQSPALLPTVFASETRPSSPFARSKSPRPPKPSREETEYLRRLLADVPSSSGSPFHVFREQLHGAAQDLGLRSTAGSSSWPKLGHVQSVEECLRMFTAVEVLDNENQVGCHRCWKIQHGEYVLRGRTGSKLDTSEVLAAECDDDDDGSSSSTSGSSGVSEITHSGVVEPQRTSLQPQATGAKANLSPATTPYSPGVSSLDLNEAGYVKSTPLALQADASLSMENDTVKVSLPSSRVAGSLSTPNTAHEFTNMPVPSISMTAPGVAQPHPPSSVTSAEAETATEIPELHSAEKQQSFADLSTKHALSPSPSRDSLKLPVSRHVRHPAERIYRHSSNEESSNPSSDESDNELTTETSITASLHSDNSSIVIPEVRHPPSPPVPLQGERPPLKSRSHSSNGVPRARQVIFRRAYKRYLISTPPPVLVIHLKRFQQVGRSPMQLQFFSNFKKLDDPVSFPEYLDLSPYLLPRKEDFGLGRQKGLAKVKDEGVDKKGQEKCMYRLYAVVEHIGNMLGGHYVAYTALPNAAPIPFAEESADSKLSSTATPEKMSTRRPITPRTTSFEATADPKPKHSSLKSSARRWCYISDTVVRLTTLEEVMKAKAYICMYERI